MMISKDNVPTVRRQCELVAVPRSSAYYVPKPLADDDLVLMRLIDEIHLERPFYGSRRIRGALADRGHRVNRKRVRRLMRQMGITALYPRKSTRCGG